jgi:hypothetical protein
MKVEIRLHRFCSVLYYNCTSSYAVPYSNNSEFSSRGGKAVSSCTMTLGAKTNINNNLGNRWNTKYMPEESVLR